MEQHEIEDNPFKAEFKYFKRKKPPPDFSTVLDFSKCPDVEKTHPEVKRVRPDFETDDRDNSLLQELGLLPEKEWAIYTGKKGFYFIRNPFTVDGQKRWIRKCLEEYSRKPSITNLDNFHDDVDVIWSPDVRKEDNERLKQLRWATFGYHHNWKTKLYTDDRKCEFPGCLKSLSRCVASSLGFDPFNPEAAIVNYYSMNSMLGGHVDNSELDVEAPLISFSFGQSAVFLLGGDTKQVRPLPLMIRSGDITVMSGESRLVYHGVPRMVKDSKVMDGLAKSCCDSWQSFAEYLKTSRVNITVRQVLKNAAKCL